MRTRVLHVLCDLNGGGAERLVLDLCRLSAPDMLPSVATVHSGGELLPQFIEAGVTVTSAGRRRGRPGARATARLARLARDADIVHTHLWAGDTWGRLGAALAGSCAVVTTEHNTGGESAWRGTVTRALDRVSDVVVGVSAAAGESVRRRGVPPERVRVIPNGVDLDRFRPTRPPHGPPWRVLAMGRLTRQKGLDVLVEAARLLPETFEVDIVGDGEGRSRLEEAARLSGGRVRFSAWSDDPAGWLRRCHVAVVPSRWEGFGLVAIEAMAAGRPVIASRVPGLEQAVGDAGVLIDPEDPVALADALTTLSADPARVAGMVAAGRDRCRLFDVRRTVETYEELYRSVALSGSGQ